MWTSLITLVALVLLVLITAASAVTLTATNQELASTHPTLSIYDTNSHCAGQSGGEHLRVIETTAEVATQPAALGASTTSARTRRPR